VFAGSCAYIRSGVGVESIAIVTMFASKRSPKTFQAKMPRAPIRPVAASQATSGAVTPVRTSKFCPSKVICEGTMPRR
jgi:hypothetical protein